MRLDAIEARVIGSLIEKQLTTPQQYPLTLNALTLACNQTSNRDPVVAYDEAEVHHGLDRLKEKGLVRFVLPSHGRSVVRYRHVLDEKLAFDQRQLALIGVLLLRGPQTVGELRTRTERMAPFDSLAEVESDLEGLTRWEDPPVVRLPRRPGQKEERWAQLLAPDEPGPATAGPATAAPATAGPATAGPATDGGPAIGATPAPRADGPGADLRADIEALKAQVELLREEVLALRLELAEITGGPAD